MELLLPSSVALAVALAVGVLLLLPGPGKQLRHWLSYRVHKRHWDRGQAVLLLRVASGAQPGLGTRWYRGVAIASRGRLDFTRSVAGLFTGRTLLLQVVGVDGERPPRVMERLLLDPAIRITQLRTPTAVLEVAVMPPFPPEAVLTRLY